METAASSRRDFPRLRETLKVSFEFVSWNETEPEVGPHGTETATYDISASGIGLAGVPTLTSALKEQLIKGLKKARLTLILADSTRLHLFGRLVWAGLQKSDQHSQDRAGFGFIEIPEISFRLLKEYVERRLASDDKPPT